jgi:hypothetical protein
MDSLLDKLVSNDALTHHSMSGGYAREWAAYKQALRRVEEVDPERLALAHSQPLNDLDEAVVALVNTAWQEGARVGAAFVRAEDEMDAPFRICDGYNGTGVARRRPNAGERCMTCYEKGYVTRDGEWAIR